MRALRWVAALILASMMGSLASCGTMGGGGGMRYLIDPQTTIEQSAST